MDQFLTGNIWKKVSELISPKVKKLAAIAYVTNDTHLSFRENDILICDASDDAIKCGETSARTLKKLFDDGVHLYCYPGLHAKVLVAGDVAVVGSSNLSNSSATRLVEASFITRRFRARSQVRAFVQKLVIRSIEIDDTFLDRILDLPVISRPRGPRIGKRQVEQPTNRTWIVSTTPLAEKIQEAEIDFEDAGVETARNKLIDTESDISCLRWGGKSRFRSFAREGDSVIQLERNKQRTRCRVIQPCAILHRQDHEKWTRFYVEQPPGWLYMPWGIFSREMDRIGIKGIGMNTTRELDEAEIAGMEAYWSDVRQDQ